MTSRLPRRSPATNLTVYLALVAMFADDELSVEVRGEAVERKEGGAGAAETLLEGTRSHVIGCVLLVCG